MSGCMTQGIHHVGLAVPDLEVARRFLVDEAARRFFVDEAARRFLVDGPGWSPAGGSPACLAPPCLPTAG